MQPAKETVLLTLLLHHVFMLTITNNKYDHLTIAIHKSVPQDDRILTEIQDLITQGSWSLFVATRNRAYLGTVTILVPDTWHYDPSWTINTSQTFQDADIRVDWPHPGHGSDPYTFQWGPCGHSGQYIHLTPGFLTDQNHDRAANYGDLGATFVHEFAHLRYGVFDEYGLGTETFPFLYVEDDTLVPTGCASTITLGAYRGNCTISPLTGTPGPDCYLVPDRTRNTAGASVMYDPSLHKVTTFCESNTNDPDYLHNDLAPNLHNKMCGGKGTWDVIMEHSDFLGGVNPPVNMTADQTRPDIRILYNGRQRTPSGVERCGRTVVLVLDLSRSMLQNHRYFKLSQTADKLIRDILPTGTSVGIVTFSTTAITRTNLTTLSTAADRNTLALSLPSKVDYGGITAIGKGLLEAKLMLETAGEHDGRIVLITDGKENEEPHVDAVRDDIVRSGLRIHSVAYSRQAESSIRRLSEDTGGHYVFYSESPTSSALDSSMAAWLHDINLCDSNLLLEVMRTSRVLTNPHIDGDLQIDSTMREHVLFAFALPNHVPVLVSLDAPDGNVYTPDSQEFTNDPSLNLIRYHVQGAQVGTWRYRLTANSSMSLTDSVVITVKGQAGNNSSPYEVSSWINSMSVDVGEECTVYVYVHKGYAPIIDADVTVTVERPTPAPPVTLTPRDDGILPDNVADDGVYSTFFTQFEGNSRYALDVSVRSVLGKTLYHAHTVIYGAARSRFHNTTPSVVTKLAENFTRTDSPGAMDVTGYRNGKDNYPPSRVTDFKVTAVDNNNRTVTLTWTAPGSDLNTGTATRYDIRMSNSSRLIKTSFKSCPKVVPGMLLMGTLRPSPAGSKETIVVRISNNWTTMVFALQTSDMTQSSGTSNIAPASFKPVEVYGISTTTTAIPITTVRPVTTPTSTSPPTATETPTTTVTSTTAMRTSSPRSSFVAIVSTASIMGVLVLVAIGVSVGVCGKKLLIRRKTDPVAINMPDICSENIHFRA
ncbi:calcium-activated chloride channel regulator 3A-1-like [Haliotis asinina]|uniref:calcium-activated chloride channel regulator 3A-1-like n=1 Tax=Haliotis asinina TaxID=109174 RepID=UPI0035320E41